MITLFFSPKEKKYYATGTLCCKECTELLSHGSPFVVQQFNDTNKKATRFFYCPICFGKIKKFGNANMFAVGIVVGLSSLLPSDCIMVVKQRIELASAYVSGGDLRNGSVVKIIDRTRFAGRDLPEVDFEALKLVAEKRIAELEEGVDFDLFIQQQVSATPILPEYSIIKQLECEK